MLTQDVTVTYHHVILLDGALDHCSPFPNVIDHDGLSEPSTTKFLFQLLFI